MKKHRFHFHRQGFALLEVSIALILTAGLTLYFLRQLQHQTAMDKITAFTDEYVLVHQAGERYINKYKVALQKLTSNCQAARYGKPYMYSFIHSDLAGSFGADLNSPDAIDCRLRDPVTMQLVTGLDGQAIDNAFALSVENLINLGLLPASMRNSGQVLPSANTTYERVCDAHTKTTYDPVDCSGASSRRTTSGPFLQIQMFCNGIPLDVAQSIVSTSNVPTICTGDLLFRTLAYSKQPLPKSLPSLNLTRTEVLFKAAQSANGNAVISLDNAISPNNGTDGLLYNTSRSVSIDNPLLFQAFTDPSNPDPTMRYDVINTEGVFAIYGDYPQPNAAKQTPFSSCNPASDLSALPNTSTSKQVGTRTLVADPNTSVMVCGNTSVTGYCSDNNSTTCWLPLSQYPATLSGGRDIAGYPLGYYNFNFPADKQDHRYP